MMGEESSTSFISSLNVLEKFPPSKEFQKNAWVRSNKVYETARQDPEKFWANAAKELEWSEPWNKVLEWTPPDSRWFIKGKINASYNCLDRHLNTWRKNKAAIHWEGEPGDSKTITYHQLYNEVNKLANTLKQLGLEKGDIATLYMPMIPELPIAMLACNRIGALHNVIFAGYSPKSLSDRINQAQSKIIITANHGYRKGRIIPLKENVDEALQNTSTIEQTIVFRRSSESTIMKSGRDHWWHELTEKQSTKCDPEPMDSESPIFILHTSGTTGTPKGVVHANGGYLVGATLTAKWIFDLKDNDIYWCTADIGWITGHSYIVYEPLALGATEIMYEGSPDYPKPDRFWQIVERYGVSIFYTAPTAIRAFMKWGDKLPKKHDLSSLRLLGSVGEPINPSVWLWYRDIIGGGRCQVVDTWWQTETGMILISPLPGVTILKPGSAGLAFPGVDADIVDEDGVSVPAGQGGFLVVKGPWPGMLKTLHREPERFIKSYWSKFPGSFFTGDGARRDEDGFFWILGRVDDVMNVSGHRLGTMEVESALTSHEVVAEAAVVGRPHSIKGQSILAFVVLREGILIEKDLVDVLRKHVRGEIGPIASPDEIRFVDRLPKTRSGKIMRRVIRALASGYDIGDITTLEDPSAVEEVRKWLSTIK
jgi:acetyl-CoA synthetase